LKNENIMSPTEIVTAFFEAGTTGDAKALIGFFAEDAVWDNRIDNDPMGGVYEGRDAILAELLEPLFQFLPNGITTTIERTIESDGAVVCLNTGHGITEDGQSFDKRYAHVFDFRNDFIARVTEFRA